MVENLGGGQLAVTVIMRGAPTHAPSSRSARQVHVLRSADVVVANGAS
ncbi:MAG: hypothetical protein R2695_20545 [Acidimicrobiales bacterium]